MGAALLIGFVTAFAAAILAIGTMATGLSWIPRAAVNLLDNGALTLLIIAVAASVFLLGPGALSLDARLFGRREIIIPGASRRGNHVQ